MWRQRIESSRLTAVAARSIGVFAVDVVVVHGRPLSIPFNTTGMPMALIEVVISKKIAIVTAGAIDAKTIHRITIER
ncbi:MAG: hypothetical protein EBY15_13970 [Gammaproteobacteria bacterium]|nr:hypothetical protein [Gammaproteobacteria bacterium]